MPSIANVRNVLPTGFSVPVVDRVWQQPQQGTGSQVDLGEHRQRLEFPRYAPDHVDQTG